MVIQILFMPFGALHPYDPLCKLLGAWHCRFHSVMTPTKICFHPHSHCSFPLDPLLSVDTNALSFTHSLAPK